MAIKKYINLNDYTLLKDSGVETIRFYPESAILKQKVTKTDDTLYINFKIEKDSKSKASIMHVTLINSNNEELYSSYSIYLKEASLYKYIILSSLSDYENAEVMPSLIIDFNKLNYNNFLDILAKNEDLSRMVPELKKALETDIASLAETKNMAQLISIQSPLNYYQNITGYLINEIENMVANDEEEKLTKTILKSFKNKYEVALNDTYQINLSFLSLLANVLTKTKSNNLTPKSILTTAELKTDTDKESITYKDLNHILNSIVDKEKYQKPLPSDLNIVEERIAYLIETKPRIKKFTNLIKIIICNDKYLDKTKRVRALKETELKELILKSLSKLTYRTLPRNQILLYNVEDNVDFIAILSIDKIHDLIRTYSINRNSDKKYQDLYKELNKILDNKVKKDNAYLEILIINLIAINIYYYKNVSNNILLIDKGDAIINLDYDEGEYAITIINKNNNKKYASITKLNEDTKDLIKIELNKGEKSFTSLINKIIYQNIYQDLLDLKFEITINNLNHHDIKIKLPRNLKEDIFYGEFDLEALLKILANIKELKKKVTIEKEEIIIPEPVPVEKEENTISKEEINKIIRKASAIAEVMNTQPIDNDNYKLIAEIYNEYKATKNENLIATLKDALEKK